MAKRFDYNLLVIGAGSGGLVSAYLAATLKARVALLEGHKMGGDCLNTGCVPSKALIQVGKAHAIAKNGKKYGFHIDQISSNFTEIMDYVRSTVAKISPNDSVERYTSLGVDCIPSFGKLLDAHTVDTGERKITARSIILASGARPFMPEISGLDLVSPLNSDSIWNLKELPRRLLVLGGGAIGCELAQAFQRIGSKVTLVERNPRILPREDREVSELIQKKFLSEGMCLETAAKDLRFTMENNTKKAIFQRGGVSQQIEFDEVLIALGRKPNSEKLGFKEIGGKLRSNGTVETNSYMRTNISNIYACGDLTGPFQFTHFAGHSAITAVTNALFWPIPFPINLKGFSWATFTDPEVARVGLCEEEAKQQGVEYEVTQFSLSHLDRAITDSAEGFIKVLTVPRKDQILGATIVGPSAGEMIMEFALGMKLNFGLKKILGTVHPYPSYADGIKLTAGAWQKKNVPSFANPLLEVFHRWRR